MTRNRASLETPSSDRKQDSSILSRPQIAVLIGNNCVQAIKPHKVIHGKPRDPYTIHTTLGWA